MAPSVQTSYTQKMPVAVAGMLGDIRDCTVESYAAEVAAIAFGLGVIAGTDPLKQVKLPATGGGVFRGVSMHEQAQEQGLGTGLVSYKVGDAVNTLRKGLIWVQTAGAVAIDVPAFFVNSGADAGKFDDLDDGSTDAVPGGVFRSATTGAGLALLEINLPA